jgi:hypothetical protein
MTPADLAMVDQAMAAFGDEPDRYLTVFRQLRDKRGEAQASADMCALFNSHPSHQVAATLAVALIRIANGGES